MLKRLTTAAVILVIVSSSCECSGVTHSESSLGKKSSSNGSGGDDAGGDADSGSLARSFLLDNGLSRTLRHVYAQCAESEDFYWCSKVQATKMLGRALKVQNINIIDGLTIVRKQANATDTTRTGRATSSSSSTDAGDISNLSNRDIEKLSMKSLDALLFERFYHFVQSRQIQISLPRMLAFGQRNSQDLLQDAGKYFMSLVTGGESGATSDGAGDAFEGRHKKKDDKKYLGPFIAAVLLKAAILKLAYHSIAIVAGKALIVGKIALIISAIIGLKKLVSTEGGEKTTYEIVKHPQVQQSHTYSSSHSSEYDGGHESGGSGSYHRSIDDEMMMQDKAYHAWVPTTKIS